MKTSNVVASLLFGAIAAAAPLDKRVLVTKTNVVVETVVVWTTVYDGEVAVPAPTTSAAAFYEEHKHSRKPKPAEPSSTYVAPVVSSAAPPPPAPVYSQAPAVSSQAPVVPSPAPVVSSVYVAPPPSTTEQPEPTTEAAPTSTYVAPTSTYVAPSPAPAASSSAPSSGGSSSGGGSGEVHSGGSMTMNYFGGALGSCGDPVEDDSNSVALGASLMGAATVDYMTGKTTNSWCNKKVAITYNGATYPAVIRDTCPGCTDGGFDMTPSLWKTVTGGLGGDSGDRITGMTWVVVD